MKNISPHAANCSQTQPLQRVYLAYFCPECERRIGFVEDAEGEEIITKSLEDDLKNMGF